MVKAPDYELHSQIVLLRQTQVVIPRCAEIRKL